MFNIVYLSFFFFYYLHYCKPKLLIDVQFNIKILKEFFQLKM